MSAVANHWIHERFAKNLISASHARELREAGLEWSFFSISHSEEFLKCHLCNRRIKNYTLITNRVNKNELVIGHNCYDKLVQFLGSGQVRSTCLGLDDQRRKLRDYLNRKIADKTFLGWFQKQADDLALPSVIAELVRIIGVLGFAPTYEDADKVVDYYRSHRYFAITIFFSVDELILFEEGYPDYVNLKGVESLRTEIQSTLDLEKSRLERKLLKAKKLREAHEAEELKEQEKRNACYVVGEVGRWLRNCLRIAQKAVDNHYPWVMEEYIFFKTMIELDLASRASLSSTEKETELEHYRESIKQWKQDRAWTSWEQQIWIVDHERSVVVVTEQQNQVEMKILPVDDGPNRLQVISGHEFVGELPGKSGLYFFRVSPREEAEHFNETRFYAVGDRPHPFADFNVRDKFDRRSYVGFFEGKIVLPHLPVKYSGQYGFVVLQEETKYYRAWVFKT